MGEELAASWDVFYLTKEGMEAHLQLRGDSDEELLERAERAIVAILAAEGTARPNSSRRAATAPEVEKPSRDDPPACPECGRKMAYREGKSRSGRPYKGFFCRTEGCQGRPVWLDDRRKTE